jgi:hypothetical protein
MSQPKPAKSTKEELRAQAHSERHRIHVQLQDVAHQVSGGLDPEDVHEPGAAWKPEHRHDGEVAKALETKRSRPLRHWKTKMWKRRTARRQAKAEAMRLVSEG